MPQISFFTLFIIYSTITFHTAQSYSAQSEDRGVMTQAEWLARMREELPKDVCDKDDFIQHCYGLKNSECEKVVRVQAVRCAQAQNPPTQINIFGEGIRLSMAVGQCLAGKLEKQYADTVSKDARCKNVYKWLGGGR
jgi:hypothetical protein